MINIQAVVDCLREISTPPYLPNMLLSYLPSIHDAWTTGDIEDLHEPNTVQFIAVVSIFEVSVLASQVSKNFSVGEVGCSC